MSDVHLKFINYAFAKIVADPGIVMELAEHFTYFAPGYKFNPRFKMKQWDGRISIVNRMTCLVPMGLAKRIKKFCDREGYTMTFDPEFAYSNVKREEVEEFIKHLGLPDWLELRDYQVESVWQCILRNRATLLSPTSSGKSLMIYLLHQWYEQKSLIIVPSNGLVDQFKSDLREYGYEGNIVTSKDKAFNKDKVLDADVVISTWQSLYQSKTNHASKEFLQQFPVVFGDEAHGAKAAGVKFILESMPAAKYRFGTTGTLGEDELSKVTIEGVFGSQFKSTTTRELIDNGYATDIKIKAIVLHYPDEVKKAFHKKIKDGTGKGRKKSYHEEIEFINSYDARIKFVRNLARNLKGNKLVFFRYTDHGQAIYDALKDEPNVFYIDGGVKDREEIRVAMEQYENAILIASTGTTSTGVSIKKLHHMIASAPQKGSIKLLQSIGRMLRQHESKSEAFMYDIVDDLCHGSQENFAYQHFKIRAAIYDQEQFDYTIVDVNLK